MWLKKNLNGEICKYIHSTRTFEQVSVKDLEITDILDDKDVLNVVLESKEIPKLKSIAKLLAYKEFESNSGETDSNYLLHKKLTVSSCCCVNNNYFYSDLHAFITKYDKLLICTSSVPSKSYLLKNNFIVIQKKVFVVLKEISAKR